MYGYGGADAGGEAGVPGVGHGWVVGGLYRYPTPPSHIPIFSHILALRPYPRPYEALRALNDEVSQMFLRYDPR